MPPVARKVLAVAFALGLGLFLWDTPVVYPLKLLVVLVHEAGHGLAAKAVGGVVENVSINRLEGGVCHFRYDPTFVNKVVTASAGYLGSALAGAVLLLVTLRRSSGRSVLWALCVFVLAVALAWGRDLFTVLVSLGLAAALGLAARLLSTDAAKGLALFLATFICLYSLFDLKDDLWDSTRRAGTDAAILAQATLVPSVVWAALWSLFALLMLGGAMWLGTRGRKPGIALPGERRRF